MTNDSAPVPNRGQACPFCGVATEAPHETQEGCIAALHEEITRMRGILDHLRPLGALTPRLPRPDESGA